LKNKFFAQIITEGMRRADEFIPQILNLEGCGVIGGVGSVGEEWGEMGRGWSGRGAKCES